MENGKSKRIPPEWRYAPREKIKSLQYAKVLEYISNPNVGKTEWKIEDFKKEISGLYGDVDLTDLEAEIFINLAYGISEKKLDAERLKNHLTQVIRRMIEISEEELERFSSLDGAGFKLENFAKGVEVANKLLEEIEKEKKDKTLGE